MANIFVSPPSSIFVQIPSHDWQCRRGRKSSCVLPPFQPGSSRDLPYLTPWEGGKKGGWDTFADDEAAFQAEKKKKKHVLSFPQIKLPPRKKKVLTAISACGENFDFFFHNPCQFPVCHTCHNACGEVLLLLLLSLLIPLFFLKSPPLSTGWCTSQVRSKRSCFNVDKWYCSLLFFSPPLFYLACCTTECGWVSPGGGKRRGSCYFMHPYIHRQTL